MGRLLCWIGIHIWVPDFEMVWRSGEPGLTCVGRGCLRCGKEEDL